MSVGESLLGIDGNPVTVEKVNWEPGAVTVFNFEVEGLHSYFAGQVEVLVHNCDLITKFDNLFPEDKAYPGVTIRELFFDGSKWRVRSPRGRITTFAARNLPWGEFPMNDNLLKFIEECVKSRDATVPENKIVAFLRGADEAEALLVVKELAVRQSPCAVRVARRVLGNKEIAREFFLFMLPGIDAGGIRILLEFALVKLGPRRLADTLISVKDKYPIEIQKALYWLPALFLDKDQELIDKVRDSA